MSMSDLNDAFKLFEEHKQKGFFGGKKDETLIQLAENALGIQFPPTYKLFLKNYGSGGLSGDEIYGITSNNFENSTIPNGVWVTLNERINWELPLTHIIIASTGDGYWYILDSSQPNKEGEYPVCIYQMFGDEIYQEKVNEDFGEFLLEHVKNILEDDMDWED